MATPEHKVKRAVKDELQLRGAWFFFPPANGFGKAGIPDVVGCYPITITPEMVGKTIGAFFGIETKAPGKLHTVTELQKMRLEEIKEVGGLAVVVDNAGTLRDALDEWERHLG